MARATLALLLTLLAAVPAHAGEPDRFAGRKAELVASLRAKARAGNLTPAARALVERASRWAKQRSTRTLPRTFDELPVDKLHRVLWGPLRRRGRAEEIKRAENVLSSKIGEPRRERLAEHPEGSVAHWERSLSQKPRQDLEQFVFQLEKASALSPAAQQHFANEIIAGKNVLARLRQQAANEPAPGTVEHYLRQNGGRSLHTLRGVGRASNLSTNEREAIARLIERRKKEGPLGSEYRFHPELKGSRPDPRIDDKVSGWLPDGRRLVAYESFRAQPVYVRKPSPDDVEQHPSRGTCYLMSTLMTLAQQRPEEIPALLREGGSRRRKVGRDEMWMRVYRQSDKVPGRYLQQVVRIDRDLPVLTSNPERPTWDRLSELSSPTRDAQGRPQLWPAFVEKAYAAALGSYRNIGSGGFTDTVVMHLFGPRARTTHMKADASAWQTMTEANGRRALMTATLSSGRNPPWLRAPHAYAVLGLVEKDAKRYLRLADPHAVLYGPTPPSVIDEGRGRFLMPFDSALSTFDVQIHDLTGRRQPARLPWSE